MTTLAAFKRRVEVGDTIRAIYNEYIPARAGQTFTVEHPGPSVMKLRWNGKPYRFEWPKAREVDEVTEDTIAYHFERRGETWKVKHELVKKG